MRSRLALFCVVLLAGCGNPTRSRDAIFAEKMSLPQLYIGLKSQKQITAPALKGVFTDETGDEFWPAMECTNPNCPNRRGSEPNLFVVPRNEPNRGCPACLKLRDLKNETREQKAKYNGFVVPYVLPETKARLKELDEELKSASR